MGGGRNSLSGLASGNLRPNGDPSLNVSYETDNNELEGLKELKPARKNKGARGRNTEEKILSTEGEW